LIGRIIRSAETREYQDLGIIMNRYACLALLVATSMPTLADASSELATFDWVPISENPSSARTTTASGTLQLTLSSFSLTGTSQPPNFGPYYASGTASTANITGFTYTAADGLTVALSNVTSESLGSTTTWQTSGDFKPTSATTAGYYLISGFTLSGKTAQGSSFMIANNTGVAGATYANGVGNGDNSFNATSSIPAITDGGYWELASVTPVPLNPALPLFLSSIAGLGVFARRRTIAAT
jgi:hypothetical protein